MTRQGRVLRISLPRVGSNCTKKTSPRVGAVLSTATSTLPRQTVWVLLDQEADLLPVGACVELQPPSRCGAGFPCESQCALARPLVQLRQRAVLPLAGPSADVYPVNCQSEQCGFSLKPYPRCYSVITGLEVGKDSNGAASRSIFLLTRSLRVATKSLNTFNPPDLFQQASDFKLERYQIFTGSPSDIPARPGQ
jgi:hypothetical protein